VSIIHACLCKCCPRPLALRAQGPQCSQLPCARVVCGRSKGAWLVVYSCVVISLACQARQPAASLAPCLSSSSPSQSLVPHSPSSPPTRLAIAVLTSSGHLALLLPRVLSCLASHPHHLLTSPSPPHASPSSTRPPCVLSRLTLHLRRLRSLPSPPLARLAISAAFAPRHLRPINAGRRHTTRASNQAGPPAARSTYHTARPGMWPLPRERQSCARGRPAI